MDDIKRKRLPPQRGGPQPEADSDPQSGPELHGRPEPVPEVQQEYLRQLSEEAGEPLEELASQADAYRRLRELQHKVGRRPKRILEDEQTDG